MAAAPFEANKTNSLVSATCKCSIVVRLFFLSPTATKDNKHRSIYFFYLHQQVKQQRCMAVAPGPFRTILSTRIVIFFPYLYLLYARHLTTPPGFMPWQHLQFSLAEVAQFEVPAAVSEQTDDSLAASASADSVRFTRLFSHRARGFVRLPCLRH